MKKIYKIKNINKDIMYTALNQLWKLSSGPLILLLIPMYLGSEIQGYWYTFSSLSALSIFADLGFSNIVLQFSAHEFAHLYFDEKNLIAGNERNKKRLASFLVFTIKWTIVMGLIVFPLIFSIGFRIFSTQIINENWIFPWMLYLLGSIISFFNSIILSFIEGCNLVAKVENIKLKTSMVNTIVLIIGLVLKTNLYALAAALFISSIVMLCCLIKQFYRFILQLLRYNKNYYHSWAKEFFPLLMKYAISFISGYFIFQIYTPLMFKYHGPMQAGKVGISMSLWSSLYNVSSIWLVAILPKINIKVSKRKWGELDEMFYKSMLFCIVSFVLGLIALVILLIIIKVKTNLGDRFLGSYEMICLGIAWFFQVIINGLATYLRAHKEEPLVIPSIISSIYIFISTIILANYFKSDLLFLGFTTSYVFGFPWIIYIFLKKRKEWHNENLFKQEQIAYDSNSNIQ